MPSALYIEWKHKVVIWLLGIYIFYFFNPYLKNFQNAIVEDIYMYYFKITIMVKNATDLF